MDILIRQAEPDDYPAIHGVFSQPNVVRGTLQLPFACAEVWRKRLSEPSDVRLLVACAEGKVVGQVGLHLFPPLSRRRHTARVGMAVHDAWQGRGIGTALIGAALDLADNWLNILRLELEVYTDNEPAIRLYQRCGFAIEGTLRRFAFREGEFVDAHLMARLAPAAGG